MNYGDFRQPSDFAQKHLYFTDGIGIQDSSEFYIERKSFRNNLLMYVADGVMHIEQNGYHQVKAGELVVMRLGDQHKYYSDKKDVAVLYWMHFGYHGNDGLLEYIEDTVGLPFVVKAETMKDQLMTCIRTSQDQLDEREYVYSEMVYKMLLALNRKVNETIIDLEEKEDTDFKKLVVAYVNQHIMDKPDLEAFAKACGFSKYHFIKKFKNHYGCTPINYLYKVKIDYSKNQLSYTNLPIGHVATDLGFESQSHFARVFKNHVGITPSSHRISH